MTWPMRKALFPILGFLSIGGGWCPAQTQGPSLTFSYKGPTDTAPIAIGVGGTIPFPATLDGSSVSVIFYITNAGTASAQVSTAVTAGSGFTVSPPALTVAGSQTGAFTLSFAPKVSGQATASVTFTTADGSIFPFTLSGTGVAPNFVTSYLLNPAGNQTPIGDGGSITFPTAQVGQTGTAVFSILNNGTGPGTVGAVTISGSSFQISGLPLLPAKLLPTQTIQFTIVFAPAASGPQTGSLQVTLGTTTITISLSGVGSAATYTYQLITSTNSTAITSGGTIQFGQTQLNVPSEVTIQVTNAGNAAGGINSVTIVGTYFAIGDLAPRPITLVPGATATFTVTFLPTVPGAQTAKLLIDGATFSLAGTGLGSQLLFSFVVGSSNTTLGNNGTANFPNTVVGSTVTGSINIQNTGNVGASVNSINLTGQYFGATIPPLPASIAAGGTLAIPVSFVPNALGSLTGTMTIDNQTITLRGTGTAPAALPTYTFTGVGDTVSPATQPSIGLSLASPYSTPITGTLTLSFASGSFVTDPAMQFATGGQTVNFTIPANSTAALFGTATSVQFQTGTVGGVISLTPTFTTGQVSLTPIPAVSKSVTIAASAPVISNVQIGVVTASSFEVLISGYSTPRSVTQVTLQFTGSNLGTASLSINSDSAFTSWYQSTASNTVGSQFTASVTIAVNGDISAVQSVAATATNAKGTSNSTSVALR
jgi:hypothetical protein